MYHIPHTLKTMHFHHTLDKIVWLIRQCGQQLDPYNSAVQGTERQIYRFCIFYFIYTWFETSVLDSQIFPYNVAIRSAMLHWLCII